MPVLKSHASTRTDSKIGWVEGGRGEGGEEGEGGRGMGRGGGRGKDEEEGRGEERS